MSSTKKQIPEFQPEKEEREFWAAHNPTEFVDWSTAQKHKLTNLEADASDHFAALANFHDCGLQDAGEQARRVLSVALKSIPGRTIEAGTPTHVAKRSADNPGGMTV